MCSCMAQQTWNNFYRCHQLGPELFRRVPTVPLCRPSRLEIISTNAIGWAQNCFGGCPRCSCMGPADLEQFLLMTSAGPSIVSVGAPNALAWAQQIWNNLYQ